MQAPKTQGAAVYLGAFRPQGFGGIDRRLWALIAVDVLLIIPASRGGLFSFALVVGVGILIFVGGRVMGRYSPFLLDEAVHYLEWRLVAPRALVPDDADASGKDPRWAKSWKGNSFGRV